MNDFSYPHSTIEQLAVEQNTTVLIVSDVGFKDALVKIKLTVEGCTLLQENKSGEKNEYEEIETLNMQAPYGEALNISCGQDGFDALIQWDSFSPRKSFTRSYRIRGKRVSIETSTPYSDKRK